MSNLNPNQQVYDVMLSLKRGDFQIPNIQRGYEWDQSRVLKLLDSIMSGYPVGAIMVWQPKPEFRSEIPTRNFVEHFDSTKDYHTEPVVPSNSEPYLVLDGQQRLQSLYLSFFGSYDGKQVFLNLTEIPSDEDGDTDYGFVFMDPSETKIHPELVHLNDLINLDSDDEFMFIDRIVKKVGEVKSSQTGEILSDLTLRNNINRNIDKFKEKFGIKMVLLFQEVDRKQNYDHVLEIFERVNSAGMILTKSDLMFSTIKLKLREMEHRFSDTLEFVNQGNRYNFNTDFLIKSCLVVFDQGAKYEVKKLRNDTFIRNVEYRYQEVDTCLRQLMAWLDDCARIKCDRFLRSRLALIPILDFMLLSGKIDKPDGETAETLKQYLYMAFFMRLFSRAADSVLDKIHSIIKLNNEVSKKFPLQEIQEFAKNRWGIEYSSKSINYGEDVDLFLNIVDGGVLQIDPSHPELHPSDLRLEVDHIFPKTPLTQKGFGDVVNHLGNYRLVVRPINRRKGPQMPDQETAFWGRNNPRINQKYLAVVENLSRKNFVAFRDERTTEIKKCVFEFLNLKD